MADFKEVLQSIVNESTEAKVAMAAHSYQELLPKLKEFDKEHKGFALVCCILGSTAAADGHLSKEEFALVHAILKGSGLEMTEDQVLNLIKNFSDDETRELVVKLAHALDQDGHANLVMLCAAICSIDDTIKADEVKFLHELL